MKKRIATIMTIIMMLMMVLSINIVTVSAASIPVTATFSYADETVSLSWNKISGAEKYYIYRAANWQEDETNCIASTTKCSYIDKAAFSDAKNFVQTTESYTYSVLYEDMNGDRKVLGEAKVSFVPRCGMNRAFTASSNCSEVTLEWGKVIGATRYRVYRKSGSDWKLLQTTSSSRYCVKDLKPDTKYQFMVRPCNYIGDKYVYGEKYTTSAMTRKTGPTKVKDTYVVKTFIKCNGKAYRGNYNKKWAIVR